MAKISWNGTPYTAEPVEELANGDWHMRMQQHGPRFTVGTVILVKAKDILELAAAEMPPAPEASVAALQVAMDADKATRPTPAQLIANWRNGNPAASPPISSVTQPASAAAATKAGSVPVSPALNPAANAASVPVSPQPQETADMSSKLAALPGLAKTVAANVEAQASATSDRLTKAQAGAGVAIDKLNTVAADVEKSTSDLEDVVNQLTNGAPPLGE